MLAQSSKDVAVLQCINIIFKHFISVCAYIYIYKERERENNGVFLDTNNLYFEDLNSNDPVG